MLPILTSSPIVDAVGLALVHFVWQGTAIGLLTAAFLALAHRARSTTRYLVACGGLTLMALAVVGTTVVVFEPAGGGEFSATSTIPASAIAADASTFALAEPPAARGTATLDLDVDWRLRLNPWLPSVVAAWIAGIALLTVRLSVAWLALLRIRRRSRSTLAPALAAAVERVRAAMTFRPRLHVAESAIVDAPTVVGWLRPLLLMPVSIVADLSPTQLDAILAHELAHIRRRDHLVNGLQTILETVLFYHPAVWWVSREIRREREHCCDDTALAMVGDRVAYATALTSLEERRQHAPALSLAATGGDLLSRVQRILEVPVTRHRYSSIWTPATIAIGATTLFATLVASPAPQPVDTTPAAPASDLAQKAASPPTGALMQTPEHAASNALPTVVGAENRIPVTAGLLALDVQNASAAATPPAQVEATQFDLQAESRLMNALKAKDVTAVSELLAEQFVSTDRDGAVHNKAAFLKALPATNQDDALLQTHSLRRVNDTRWVATGTLTPRRGDDREAVHFMRVWQWTAPKWSLVSSTTFRLPGTSGTNEPALPGAPGTAAASVRVLDRGAGLNVIPQLDPTLKVPPIRFTNAAIGDLLRTVGELTKINITYDQGLAQVLTRPYTINAQSEMSLAEVFNRLLQPQSMTFKVIDPRSIFVYQDTQMNRQRFEDQYIQTFVLSNTDAANMAGSIRQLLAGLQLPITPQLSPSDNRTLSVRADERVLRLISDFIRVNDRPAP